MGLNKLREGSSGAFQGSGLKLVGLRKTSSESFDTIGKQLKFRRVSLVHVPKNTWKSELGMKLTRIEDNKKHHLSAT